MSNTKEGSAVAGRFDPSKRTKSDFAKTSKGFLSSSPGNYFIKLISLIERGYKSI